MSIVSCPVCGGPSSRVAELTRCQGACGLTLESGDFVRLSEAVARSHHMDELFRRSHDLVLVRQQDGTWHGGAERELAEGPTLDAVVAELLAALIGPREGVR